MDDLITALQIFRKYSNDMHPTNCSHDMLYVNVSPEKVSSEDIEKLEKLSFEVDIELDGFTSFRFGSC